MSMDYDLLAIGSGPAGQRAAVRRMGRLPGGALGEVRANTDAGIDPRILVIRPHAELCFADADADAVAEQIHQAAVEGDPYPRAVEPDLESTDTLDVPACHALHRLAEQLAGEGIGLTVARVHLDGLPMLERTGALEVIGAGHAFPRVEDAVLALQRVA